MKLEFFIVGGQKIERRDGGEAKGNEERKKKEREQREDRDREKRERDGRASPLASACCSAHCGTPAKA